MAGYYYSCSTSSSALGLFYPPHLFSHPSSSAKSILFQPNHRNQRFSKSLASSSGNSHSPREPDESDPVKRASRQGLVVNRAGDNGGGGGADDAVASEVSDPVRIAMEKAREYRKNKGPEGSGTGSSTGSEEYRKTTAETATNKVNNNGGAGADAAVLEVPDPVRIAMEKAIEYKKNKGLTGGAESRGRGPQKTTMSNSSELKDLIINDKVSKKEKPTFSSIDFVGLNFSDKKNDRRLPAGLSQVVEPLPEGDLPEVEIIVGDASKLKDRSSMKTVSDENDDASALYKPKVSTWGVFPRPDNISKAYGGGRTIHPGEELETAEVKAAKNARIRESVASYKSRLGLNIDSKIKIKCQKALKEGDHLMELGKLQEALPYYEEVMSSVVFQNELHGLAALQWSICQDSLRRTDIARDMYEKLKSHPNVQVSKTARQFMFGFQAMEMLKVKSTSSSRTTGYENYFDAFLDEKTNYTQDEDEQKEDSLKQVLPYFLFLLSPIFIVFAIAARK